MRILPGHCAVRRRSRGLVAALALVVLLLGGSGGAVAAPGEPGSGPASASATAAGTTATVPVLPRPSGWPLAGTPTVLRGFDPPAERYGAGHRGVDLAGVVGEAVLAAAPGTVVFAGSVAGSPAVTVDHGAVRTTYTPVRSAVPVGTTVRSGDPVGRLEPGHCPDLRSPAACLHWGLLLDGPGERSYLDPLLLVPAAGPTAGYRLVPADERQAVLARGRAAARLRSVAGAALGLGVRSLVGGVPSSGHWTPAGARAAVGFAWAQLGRPYVFGAAGPAAFDCSGLTMRAWQAGGVDIGHYTGVQWTHLQPTTAAALRPGDLVFWGTSTDPASIYHTAIYVGGGRIIQAPRPGRNVELSGLDDWIRPNFYARVPG